MKEQKSLKPGLKHRKLLSSVQVHKAKPQEEASKSMEVKMTCEEEAKLFDCYVSMNK